MVKKNNFQIGKKTLLWGYIAQFFQYGTALLILPIVLNQLPAKDMAIWYIFMSIQSIVGLIDFGFSPSISKQVSFVYSGVSSLSKEGISDGNTKSELNIALLNDLYKTCIYLYKRISYVIGLVLFTCGSVYLYFVLDKISISVAISWLLFIVSMVYNFYYEYVLVFIRGRGLISEMNQLMIISKSVQIISLYIFILLDFGLLSLVLSNLFSTYVLRLLGRKYMIENCYMKSIKKMARYNNLTDIIWYNAKRYGVASLGVVLLAQSNVFLSGIFLSLESVSQLGLTIQVFTILAVVARVPLTSYLPKFSSLFVENNIKLIRRYFIQCQLLCYLIFVIGSFFILYLGNPLLLNIVHSKTLLPTISVLALYTVFYFMELTHGNCVTLISAENKVIYYRAAIISGLISITSIFILLYFGMGIYAFPLGLIMGGLPYNAWKWPLYVYKRLKIYE